MKRKGTYALIIFVIMIFAGAITATNIKFNKNMKAVQLSSDEWFEGDGYAVKFNKYEVLDMEQLSNYVMDAEKFEMHKNVFEIDGKVVFVYITLKVTDRELMNKEWWMDFVLYADNAWHNQADLYLAGLIKDANPAKGNYENGGVYNIIFPYEIGKTQVPDYEYDSAANWKYFMIWSENPIVYMQLH